MANAFGQQQINTNAFVPSANTAQLLSSGGGTPWDSLSDLGVGMQQRRAEEAAYLQAQQQQATLAATEQERYNTKLSMDKDAVVAQQAQFDATMVNKEAIAQFKFEQEAAKAEAKKNELTPMTAKQIGENNQQTASVMGLTNSINTLTDDLESGKESLTTVANLDDNAIARMGEELGAFWTSIGKEPDDVDQAINDSIAKSGNKASMSRQGRAKVKGIILQVMSAQGESAGKLSDRDLALVIDSITGSFGNQEAVIANLKRTLAGIQKKHLTTLEGNAAQMKGGQGSLDYYNAQMGDYTTKREEAIAAQGATPAPLFGNGDKKARYDKWMAMKATREGGVAPAPLPTLNYNTLPTNRGSFNPNEL